MSIRDRIKMINEAVEDEVEFDMFSHPVDSNEDEVSDHVEPDGDEIGHNKYSEVINRALSEEGTAIETYDEILSLMDNDEDDKEAYAMFEEILQDERDHLALISHYVETGKVLTDEELHKDKPSEDFDEEEDTEEVSECDETLTESDATPEFLNDLAQLLKTHCRTGVSGLNLLDDGETVEVVFDNGAKKNVSIEGDSNIAAIKDILHIL